MSRSSRAWIVLGLLPWSAIGPTQGQEGQAEPEKTSFRWEETTIREIHRAMRDGELTARDLVDQYLERIEQFDRDGPKLNSLITINEGARRRADELDQLLEDEGLTGPLHGIPVIVKDNYDTYDLPTTAGSASLHGSIPPDDAFQVRRLREAGAIVLAKSNMAEFAFSPYHTVGSELEGHTRNPYDLSCVPAGSSGGTASAVAANLGAVGLGTDTGNSIRGPSSHCCLVGIRSTMGLCSRDGIVPLYLDRDIGGPMARTVEDAALVLGVLAGADPADPVTLQRPADLPQSYLEFLDADALEGARIGVARQIVDRGEPHPEILECFEIALEAMEALGAEIIDDVHIPEQDEIGRGERWCPRFRVDLEDYLHSLGNDAPVKTLAKIIEGDRTHPSIAGNLRYFANLDLDPKTSEACIRADECSQLLRAGIRRALQEHQLDALVYPTWSHPARKIGDLRSPHGDNSQDLSPHTGFPALTVPMGWVEDRLPAGLQFLGDAWSEPRLIALAYAFEQATNHRRPPQFD